MTRHRSFAVIGLGDFGTCVLEALLARRYEVVAIDRSETKIQRIKDRATVAVRADVFDPGVLEEVLPDNLHCAVIGLGNEEHAATLVTHHLAGLGVPNIVVEATDPQHAEILRIVGATRVVNPQEEAAERVVGLLAGPELVEYFAVSDDFCLIEIHVPDAWSGKTLTELDLRPDRIQVVAVRHQAAKEKALPIWHLLARDEPLSADDIVLVAGTRRELDALIE